jgi:subtilase family protein
MRHQQRPPTRLTRLLGRLDDACLPSRDGENREVTRPVRIDRDVPGQDHAYVPGELIVQARGDQRSRVERLLASRVGRAAPQDLGSGATRFSFDPDVRPAELARTIRAELGLSAAPNHVLFGQPASGHLSPATPPEPTEESEPPPDPAGEGHATVAILDSGIDPTHPWFGSRVSDRGPVDVDATDVFAPQGSLDWDAGHGTFIAGIVRGRAPGARILVRRVMREGGVVDDVSLAQTIRSLAGERVDVLNLSLGGYTADDLPPPETAAAIRTLDAGTVVVAAAGNAANGCRPFWPAAVGSVLAVGSLDADGAPSWFTNWGEWVDACAQGEDVLGPFVTWSGPVDDDPGFEWPLPPGPRTFTGWARWSGTSFAAPQLAGAIAAAMLAGAPSAAAAAAQVLDPLGHPVIPGLGVAFDRP